MSRETEEARKSVIRAGLELQRTGLIARTWGNISARISDTQFVITPSGLAYDSLTPADIVAVNIEDLSWEGSVKPSSEKGVHAIAYQLRPDVRFVIHTHQNYASALSTTGHDLENVRKYSPEAADVIGPSVPCAEYGLNASQQLIDAVGEVISGHPDCRSFFMRNHGTLCLGSDYENAFAVAHSLEKVCEKCYGDLIAPVLGGVALSDMCYTKDRLTILRDTGEECVILSRNPYAVKCSESGREQRPYIDDQAQIAGVSVRCVAPDASAGELQAALQDRNAVFLRGKGVLCTGSSLQEAEAVAIVVEKGCMAALLAEAGADAKAVNPSDAREDRMVYVNSYSKLMTKR